MTEEQTERLLRALERIAQHLDDLCQITAEAGQGTSDSLDILAETLEAAA